MKIAKNFPIHYIKRYTQHTGSKLFLMYLQLYHVWKFPEELLLRYALHWHGENYSTKKFFTKDFFSKCDQIRCFLRIWSHLLKKFLMENFPFCTLNRLVNVTTSHLFIGLVFLWRRLIKTQLYLQGQRFYHRHEYIYKCFNRATHCVKSILRSFFCSAFTYIQAKYRKIRTRKTSVFRQFSHSGTILKLKMTNIDQE